jgi:hypothetical protein
VIAHFAIATRQPHSTDRDAQDSLHPPTTIARHAPKTTMARGVTSGLAGAVRRLRG